MEQSTFWSESFWLPVGTTWKDLENKPGSNIYLPQYDDMLWSIPLGLCLLAFRFVFENYMMAPLGFWMGVKKDPIQTKKLNPVLEEYFAKNGVSNGHINTHIIAKQIDMTDREVERFLRDFKKKNMPSNIQKFNECGWHFAFYLGAFVYGLIVLWDKPWFWETTQCWRGWPNLDVGIDVYYYYMAELSFYWCLFFSIMTEHRRKDFVQMIVHHIATIALIYFSWTVNFVRIGTLVLITHDAADFPMAAAKMFKYSGHKTLCEVFLTIFIIVWVISRLVYYPFVVLYSASVEVYDSLTGFPSYYFFNGLLILLQVLHLIWTYMIARIAVRKIFHDKLEDIRSGSESDSD